jgi:anti-sigma B factor antagonist
VLRFSDDITGISNDAVFNAYRQVPAAARKLVLDFTKVEYINSSGIALMIHLMMAVNKDNRAIQSFGCRRTFKRCSQWSA